MSESITVTDPAAPAAAPPRFIIVGVGAGILNAHRPAIEAVGGVVVGVTDVNASIGAARAEELGCPFYPDLPGLLGATDADAAIIITPHPFHAALTIACLDAGQHVLVEKPMAIEVAEADAMIAAAERSGRVLAVNFQQRTRPEVIAAHRLIRQGALGVLQHADMTMTWPRTAAYFRSSNWRGRWHGEGGGVLMNQAPHELDLLCHLLGMPARVVAWTRQLLHTIETEDTIQAMIEWPGGALGALHISTAEAGQDQRFEIMGTGGHLSLQPGGVRLRRFETDLREFLVTSEQFYSGPPMHDEMLALDGEGGDHRAIYRDFVRVLRNGGTPVADGRSARQGLELANAITLSSHTGQTVEFPVDRQQYAELLAGLRGRVMG